MNKKDTLESELRIKATAEVQESVAADLEQEDGDLEALLKDDDTDVSETSKE